MIPVTLPNFRAFGKYKLATTTGKAFLYQSRSVYGIGTELLVVETKFNILITKTVSVSVFLNK